MGRVAKAEVAVKVPPAPGTQLPPIGERLWSAIEPIVSQPAQAGARPLLNEKSQALLRTFLTTPKSMRDLTNEPNGLRSRDGVRRNLHTSMGTVYPFLSEDIRRDYPTAKDALQAVAADPIKTEATRRKMRENERPGWKKEKPRHHAQNARKKPGEGKRGSGRHKKTEGEPKIICSGDHHTHLSEGATRRWQRYHEQETQAQGATPDQ